MQKKFYSKRHIPLFSFPYNCKRKASGTKHKPQSKHLHNAGESESKRLQRHALDAKQRGEALSKYA